MTHHKKDPRVVHDLRAPREGGNPLFHGDGVNITHDWGKLLFLAHLALQLSTNFFHVGNGHISQKFSDLRVFVFCGKRQNVKRRQIETLSKALNRADRDCGQPMLDARQMTLRQCTGFGQIGEGHIALEAEFANTGANLLSVRIGRISSRHVIMVLGRQKATRPASLRRVFGVF